MPNVLQAFPSEIVELISSNVSTKDLLSIIQVSKPWYRTFYNFLYKTLLIDSVERQNRVVSAFDKGSLPGHHVQLLAIFEIKLKAQDVKYIVKMFPNVNTLAIEWAIWDPIPCHLYFDADTSISDIHPPQGLSPMINDFFHKYGTQNLRHLSIDGARLNNDRSIDVWSILALCPRLKSLKLLNLNHEHTITSEYLEMVHRLCSQLTSLTIKCTRADPVTASLYECNETSGTNSIAPTTSATCLKSFSLSSKSGSAKWPYWLPYFSVKYPQLQHVSFKHCGIAKERRVDEQIPDQVYTMFRHACRQLKSISWNNVIVQHDEQEGLFGTSLSPYQQYGTFHMLERIEAFENFLTPGSVEFSNIIRPNTLMSNLLTSLTIGQPPTNITTSQIIQSIGTCKNLQHLKLQECSVDPELAYSIDDILIHCQSLVSLYFKDVHVNLLSNDEIIADKALRIRYRTALLTKHNHHPLKKLVFKRSSLAEGVFEKISGHCLRLDHVEMIGCFQTDKRDQIKIALPLQHLKTLKIHGLRTRHYYTGCRIRFFKVETSPSIPVDNVTAWYYMTQYDVKVHPVGKKKQFQKYRHMEFATQFNRLDEGDVENLKALVTTETLKDWDVYELKKNLDVPVTRSIDPSCWDPENIYYSGFVNIHCKSVQELSINSKLVL